MTIREQIVKEVANTEDSGLLQEMLMFLKQKQEERQRDPSLPPRGSYEAIMRHRGVLNDADAQEMRDIIDREFNTIEGEW